MVFTTIIFLIVLLCGILFVTYIIQELKLKSKIQKIKKETKKTKILKSESIKTNETKEYNPDDKTEMLTLESSKTSENEIEAIANKINDALKEEKPIDLTNFEEDQEKTAIISIDELYEKAKELEIVDDDNGEVNYLEKYNLEPAEVRDVKHEENKAEVKAFKVSQVISPIYGVKKEVINNNNK